MSCASVFWGVSLTKVPSRGHLSAQHNFLFWKTTTNYSNRRDNNFDRSSSSSSSSSSSQRKTAIEMSSSPTSYSFLARNCSRALHQMVCSTSGRCAGSFAGNDRSVVTAALNGQQQGSAAAAPQQQRSSQMPQQAVKPVQVPPRLTNNGVMKKENLPPFQSQTATTTRQQQQEQQFRSIPPQPLPKVNNNNNNNNNSNNSNTISSTSVSSSETGSALPQSRLEGKLVPDDVDAAYHQLQHLGQKWADLHAEAEILEEAKKCILATITLFHVENGDAKSTAEVRAHASKEYQDHIKKMVEARRLANQAKIELESVKTHLNLVRTFESSRREELKML